LETGKLELDDLAPRIKDLKGRINELEGQQLNMLEHMQEAKIELLGRTKVKAYVDDLRTLLSKGTLIEQKAFLRSFVKRIRVEYPRVVLDYTIPLNAQKAEPLTREVLPFVEISSPGRTRTSDQLVNSQPLYRLSYRGIGLSITAPGTRLYSI
jgi:site-specific DNA recombinase